jgi:hypothetical protein
VAQVSLSVASPYYFRSRESVGLSRARSLVVAMEIVRKQDVNGGLGTMTRVLVLVSTLLIGWSGAVLADADQRSLKSCTTPLTLSGEPAGQGCCSWHGGQCGCSGSRVECCDGTLSPSCKCAVGDPTQPIAPKAADDVTTG